MSTCTCQHDGTKLTDVCALHAQFAREQSAAENAALRAELAFARSTGDESALEYHALKARLAEAERDAARYRWLRDAHGQHIFVTRHVGGATIPRFAGSELDALIDKAGATDSADVYRDPCFCECHGSPDGPCGKVPDCGLCTPVTVTAVDQQSGAQHE